MPIFYRLPLLLLPSLFSQACGTASDANTSQNPIEGTWKTLSHTVNTESCDQEGADAPSPLDYFKLSTYTLQDAPYISINDCASVTECEDEPYNLDWRFETNVSNGAAGERNISKVYEDSCEVTRIESTASVDDAGQLTMEKKTYTGLVPVPLGKACDDEGIENELADTYKDSDELTCTRLEIVVADRES